MMIIIIAAILVVVGFSFEKPATIYIAAFLFASSFLLTITISEKEIDYNAYAVSKLEKMKISSSEISNIKELNAKINEINNSLGTMGNSKIVNECKITYETDDTTGKIITDTNHMIKKEAKTDTKSIVKYKIMKKSEISFWKFLLFKWDLIFDLLSDEDYTLVYVVYS